MSLISDADYLIHSLRLTYLRHVEDPYGPRLISLSPSYDSNPHILASGLADTDVWPEITAPATPPVTLLPLIESNSNNFNGRGDQQEPSGFPGATGLKYTQTILGPSRTGLAGMRVSGTRRASVIKESPIGGPQNLGHRSRADSEPTPSTDSPAVKVHVTAGTPQSVDHSGESKLGAPRKTLPNPAADPIPAPPPPPMQFIPQFARAKEMEEKRLQRMRARNPALLANANAKPEPEPEPAIDSPVEDEDEDEEATYSESEYDEDEDDHFLESSGIAESQDDEFDPEFARAIPASAVSDESSILSLPSAQAGYGSSLHPMGQHSAASRSRLSPVSEADAEAHTKTQAASSSSQYLTTKPHGSSEKPPALPHPNAQSEPPPERPRLRPRGSGDSTSHSPSSQHVASSSSRSLPVQPTMAFPKEKVPPRPTRPAISGLSSMLAKQSQVNENPFAENYINISGRAETASVALQVYFPHSKKPTKPVSIKVRKDATVEEVIGFGLWTYWDQGFEPKLDEGLGGDDDPKRLIRLTAAGWSLRLVEDDGEVDEDFPAPDRTAKIAKFGFDEFAICEASGAQLAANQALEVKIARKPSGLLLRARAEAQAQAQAAATPGAQGTAAGLAPPAAQGTAASVFSTSDALSVAGGMPVSSSMSIGGSTAGGPPVFLRIRVAETADVVLRSTTINATTDMYLADVLDTVCRKRKITDPKEWALLSGDMKILIPLDRTVSSLQGTTELVLWKRAMLPEMGLGKPAKTNNPNDSIFKRLSEVPKNPHHSVMDFTDAYKSFVVHRKLPMLVGRLERTLAIDGEHIHIMPSAKAFLDNMKTSSYHIGSVQSVRQSGRGRSNVKLVVLRDGGSKTYEFEAENEEAAAAIVQRIRNLQKVERSGTVNKGKRRSRTVV